MEFQHLQADYFSTRSRDSRRGTRHRGNRKGKFHCVLWVPLFSSLTARRSCEIDTFHVRARTKGFVFAGLAGC